MSTEAFLEKAENGGRDVLATTSPASTPEPLSPVVSVDEEEGA